MKKCASTVFLFFLIIMVISPSAGSQYLIQTNDTDLRGVENISVLWQNIYRDVVFAVVSNLAPLDRASINYFVLDEDVETGNFYWVNAQFMTAIDLSDFNTINTGKVLWNDEQRVLVRVKSGLFLQELPSLYTVQKICFHTAALYSEGEAFAPPPDTPPPIPPQLFGILYPL